ncbi:hypothetical protein [Sinorhizobium meliloti]
MSSVPIMAAICPQVAIVVDALNVRLSTLRQAGFEEQVRLATRGADPNLIKGCTLTADELLLKDYSLICNLTRLSLSRATFLHFAKERYDVSRSKASARGQETARKEGRDLERTTARSEEIIV